MIWNILFAIIMGKDSLF